MQSFHLDQSASEILKGSKEWTGLNFTGIMRNLVYGFVVMSYPRDYWSSTIAQWYDMFEQQDRYPNPIWEKLPDRRLVLRGRIIPKGQGQ